MVDNFLSNITKIGNYVLPIFGAFLTATFSISTMKWEGLGGQYIIAALSIYTMLSAFVSYWHRIKWLRHQTAQKVQGVEETKLTDLSLRSVAFFLILHFVLIVILGSLIYIFVW